MFRSRTRLMWSHAAVLAGSGLILDRSRKLVGLQSPAACATLAVGDSGPNFENCDLFHAQFPDTGRGVHARMWQANRDANAMRMFPWLSVRAQLSALLRLVDGSCRADRGLVLVRIINFCWHV